ncbi:MAG: transglycosylase domain-containing protein, partial [Steroidobacteraceae bacterium]
RKIRQMRTARGLEARWTKPQILEAYLNLLGFRGELAGIGAAALELAGKTPAGLDGAESLVLAALLPAPGADAHRIAARACARALALARPAAPAAGCAAIDATTRELLARRRPAPAVPHLAPQLAQALLTEPGARVTTTLDARLQALAGEVLASHLSQLTARNVRDGAVLVADTTTGDVLAYVASARGSSRAALVDGIRARRQAGSTLKPFLYGLALEHRYLTAASLLDDSPVNLDTASGLYIPQNYDRDFKGLVSVRSALGNSLNVPAVRALVLTGVDAFRDRLFDLGFTGISRPGDYYGFSLALGSAEVSLWEQAQAWRTLARGGLFSPLRLRRDEPRAPERRVLRADASFVIADILADPAARAATFGPGSHLDTAFWSAVKTGTSKDMRDNWCLGFSPRYTVAVWVGNFEGDSMHDVSGVTGAAPVWAELMAALHRGLVVTPPRPPPGVSATLTAFAPAVEGPRREWFLDGTAQSTVTAAGPGDAIARIASPANATVIALDPDIPMGLQRVAIRASGAAQGLRLRLDNQWLGEARATVLWPPRPGPHRLALVDASGRAVDQVLFTVR